MKTNRVFIVFGIALALLGLASSRAMAKEIVGVTISGPGLPGEIQISDPRALETASAPWFDLRSTVQPADLPKAGYFEIRMAIGGGDQVVATNVFHYYPGAGDRPGYFYYAECPGCSSGSTGEWYQISAQEDLALRELLVSLGASAALAGGGGEASDAPAGNFRLNSAFRQATILPTALLAVALIALAAFVLLRSRTNKPGVNG